MAANNIPDTVYVVFTIGAVLSLSTILWSVFRVPELPLSDARKPHIDAQPKTVAATLGEIWRSDPRHAAADAETGRDDAVPMVCDGDLLDLCDLFDRALDLSDVEPVSDGFRQRRDRQWRDGRVL